MDSAKKFDITKHKDTEIKKRLQKGLDGKMGIKIIRLICDKINYIRKNNTNITTLIKYK